MTRIVIGVLCLLILSSTTVFAVNHTISAIPYTIPIDWNGDTVLIAGTKISSPGYGISFAAGCANIVLDGQGDTIVFGTATSPTTGVSPVTGDIGIRMNLGAVTNCKIVNLHVLHQPDAPGYDSTENIWAIGVRWGPSNKGVTLDSVRIKVQGRNSKIMYSGGGVGSYNNDIIRCNFIDSCHAFLRRDYWLEQSMCVMAGMNIGRSAAVDFNYHWKFDQCSTLIAFWSGIYLEGDSTIAIVSNNYLTSDGWNSLDTAGNDLIMQTAGECYALVIRQDRTAPTEGQRVKVFGNTFRVGKAYPDGVTHAGGRAIFISGVDGLNVNYDDSCVAIYDNDIDVHQGNDGYATTLIGVIVRDDWSRVRIHHNTIKVTNDATPPNNQYGDGPSCAVRVTGNTGSELYLKHNTLTAIYDGAFVFDGSESITGKSTACIILDENYPNQLNIQIDSNILISNNLFIRWGFYNGDGGNPQTIGNTFRYYGGTSPNDANTWTAYFSRCAPPDLHAYPNTLRDGIFENGVSDQHIYFDPVETDYQQVDIKYTTTVNVIDASGLPIAGASIAITNAYGLVVGTGVTGPTGTFDFLIKTYHGSNSYYRAAFGGVDSTSFNPLSVQASKGADVAVVSHTLTSAARTVNVTLSATDGVDPSIVAVDHFVIDSSLTATYNTIGIPRYQIAPYSTRGWLTVFAPTVAANSRPYEMYTTKNLDQAWASRWVNKARGGSASNQEHDHQHLSVYNDTIYAGTDVGDNRMIFHLVVDSLTRIMPGTFTGNPHHGSMWRLPGSDTVIALARWSPEPNANNVSYAISTDKGATFGAWATVPSPAWSTFGGNIRTGGMIFNNTVVFGADSVNGGGRVRWWEFNRATSSWTDLGAAISITSNSFHAFAMGMNDTMRFAAGTRDNILYGGVERDTLYTGYRGINASSWTVGQKIFQGYMTGSFSPYVAMTHIDSTNRTVMFHSYAESNTPSAASIMVRRWIPELSQWGPATKISRGTSAWKVSTAMVTPTSHGDVAYAQIIFDSVIGGSTWHFSEIVRIRFGTQEVEPVVDSFAIMNDTTVTEGSVAALVVTISPTPTTNFTYQYATRIITASSLTDYITASGSATILAGHTKDTLYINTLDDLVNEPSEIFRMTLTAVNPDGYTGVTSDLIANVTIVDNDAVVPPTSIRRIRYIKR